MEEIACAGVADHPLYPRHELGTGVISIGVLRLVIIYSLDQCDTLRWHVEVVQSPLQLNEVFDEPIWFVDYKFILFGTVIGDMKLSADFSQGQNIGNPIRVVPHCPISTELTHEVGPGDPCIAMDVHPPIRFTDVSEEPMVAEDRDSGLAVE